MNENQPKMNSELTPEDLANHIGHRIVITTYGNQAYPVVNIALECEECSVLLADCNPPR